MTREKQALAEGDAVTLTKAQQRTAMALFVQRQRVMDEANKEIEEIKAAIDDLARMYAVRAGWAEEGEYFFDQAGPGMAVVLKREELSADKGEGEAVPVVTGS